MRAIAIGCFFLSGASSLVFQVIWTRLFSLVFGTTTLAISTVLTAFMTGLALGAFGAGRIADRIKSPLLAYAGAEALIGLCALAIPLATGPLRDLNSLAYAHYPDSQLALNAIRFAASWAVIVLPTTLMGATLPLLSRHFVRDGAEHRRVGARVGTLYAVNTAGAVVGTLAAGFVLLPQIGLRATNATAASINLILAIAVVAALALARRRRRHADPAEVEARQLLRRLKTSELEATPRGPPPPSQGVRSIVLVAFFLSGATAMVYEVLWARALSLSFGSSVYSFSLVLSTFLIGLAAGAAVIGRLTQNSPYPAAWLAVDHLAIAVCVALSYLLMDEVPGLFVALVQGETFTASGILRTQGTLAALTLLPATFAMGGVFPLTIRLVSLGLDRVGRDVGTAYAINTIGAIVGSFLGGFVVVPLLQLQPGIRLAAAVNIALAALIAALSRWPKRWRLALIVASVALASLWPFLPRWDLYDLSLGPFRPSIAREAMANDPRRADLVYYRDGLSTTVSVEQWSEEHFSLKNNGKVDASTGDDMPTQISAGLLPLLLHPRAPAPHAKVALIGLASGVTAGAILQYPVERLDVVELEPAMPQAARFFNHVNNRPLQDPRLRLIADDGRNFLAAGTERYDVIINEPSNPWISGVSNLFTVEYFRIGHGRLTEDGIFCSWAQMYELGPRRIKAIYRAFRAAFPYAYAFASTSLSSDTFLVGSNKPLHWHIDRLRAAFALPRLRKELLRGGLRHPDDLVALTLLGPGEIDVFTVGAEINTDDNALVEFGAPLDLYAHWRYDYFINEVYGRSWSYGRLDEFVRGYKTSQDHAGLVLALLRQGRLGEATRWLKRVDRAGGTLSKRAHAISDLVDPPEGWDLRPPIDSEDKPLATVKLPADGLDARSRADLRSDQARIDTLRRQGNACQALDLIDAWPEKVTESMGQDQQLLWGYLAHRCDKQRTATTVLRPLAEDGAFVRQRPVVLYYFGVALYARGEFAEAMQILDKWIATKLQ